MAIPLHELTALLNKQAATPKPDEMTPGQQAMVGAAQAAGNIPGAVKAPNVFPTTGGSPAEDTLAAEQEQQAIQDQMAEKDQELERVRKERNNLELKLQQEQLSRQQAEAEAAIASKEREFEASMQAGKEELERERTRMQADETAHQALLDKQTAEQSVELAEQRADMMSEFADQQAQRYVKTTEDAAKNIAKQRDDSYKQIDNYRQQSLQAIEAARPTMSPALEYSMNNAVDAMGRINKINQRLHTLPKPGSHPLRTTAKVEPDAAPPGTVLPQSEQQGTEGYAAQELPSTPQMKLASRSYLPIPGEFSKKASQAPAPAQIPLVNQSRDLAHIDNAIWEAQRVGDEALENRLTQSRDVLQGQLDARKAELDKLVSSGDKEAQKELAAYNDLHRKYTVRSNNPAGLEPGGPSSIASGWRSLIHSSPLFWIPQQFVDENPQTSAYEDIANRGKREMLREQHDANSTWYGNIGRGIVASADEVLFSPVGNGVSSAVDNYRNMQEMAKDRGVDVNWFGANTGDQAMLDDFNQAAARYNVSTNPWMHSADAAGSVGLALLNATGVGSVAKNGLIGSVRAMAPWLRQLGGYGTAGYVLGNAAAGATSPDTPENAAGWQRFFDGGFGGNYGQWGGTSTEYSRNPYSLPTEAVADAAQAAAQQVQQPPQATQPQLQPQQSQQQQPMQPQSMPKAAATTEYSKRPMPTTAQEWNTVNPNGVFDTKGINDYYGDGIGSWLPTLSPLISAFTGGVVNLVRTPGSAYNSSYRIDPRTEAQRIASTDSNPIFRDPGAHTYSTPMGEYLQRQFTKNRQPVQIYQPTWEQMGTQMA